MSTAPHDNVRGRWLSGTSATASGFTTIELVAVIAVTLVMIAVAVSAYRTYSARRDVSQALTAVVPVQILIADAFERTGVPPASGQELLGLTSVAPTLELIETVAVRHGRVEILFGDGAAATLRGRALHVTPFETSEGHVVWRCGDGVAAAGLYPLGFISGTNRATELVTTVEPRYLPERCR
jgi:hypothetical protein